VPKITGKPQPTPKLTRPRESLAVTIVLGIKSPTSVVLAADTQETYQGSHKVNRPKLVYKSDKTICGMPVVLSVAGAGFGPWIDKLITLMWQAVQDATSFDDARDSVENCIKSTYEEYGRIANSGCDPNTEMLYVIAAPGAMGLFHAFGAIVNETTSRACGLGQPIADFLVGRMRQVASSEGDTQDLISLAIYVLASAKAHADGCGGDTNIVWVENENKSGLLGREEITAAESLFSWADTVVNLLMFLCANQSIDAKQLEHTGKQLLATLIEWKGATDKQRTAIANILNAKIEGGAKPPSPSQQV
jgi:hypothetical protein